MQQPRDGRAEASAAIWHWKVQGADPDTKQNLRLQGALQGLAGATVGALIYLIWSTTLGSIVFGIASFILLAALLSPNGVYALIHRAFAALGVLIGRLLTWVLMAGIFYTLFLPFGLLFRRGRRDPMRRFYEPEAASYWTRRQPGRTASSSRERQY